MPLPWNVLGVVAAAGMLIIVLAWFIGPGLFGSPAATDSTIVRAEVTLPAQCTAANANETVRFEVNGKTRNGTLNACGHDQGERVDVAVPVEAGAGLIDVTVADTAVGHPDLRRPVGLALLALACFGGGLYVFLVLRGPRAPAVLA
jgi:hypothetical protein